MIADKNKGIANIAYNHLNLPTHLIIDNGEEEREITYYYDATGVKLQKMVEIADSNQGNHTDYDSGFIYERASFSGQPLLKFFYYAEGYFEVNSPPSGELEGAYIYQYKDHLGNIRLSYSDIDGNGVIDPATEIKEAKDYYAFGLEHSVPNKQVIGTKHPYGYNGKEENNELGLEWLDFEARNYDAALGRWMNIDPLAEAMPDQSPYNYAFNNPVFWIDPDGRMPEEGDAGGGSETAVGGFTNSQDSYGRDLSTASHTNSAPVGSEFGLEKKKGKNENKDNPSNNLNNDLNKNSPENIDNDGRVICIKCKEGEEMVFENKYIKNNKMYFEYENMFYHRGNLGEMGFYNEKDYIELYSEVLEFVKAQQISYQIFSEIISSNYMAHKLTNLAMKFDASDYGSKMISPAHNNVAKRFLHKAFGSFFTSQPLNNGGHIDFEDSNMPILEPKDTIYKTRRAGKHKFIDKN